MFQYLFLVYVITDAGTSSDSSTVTAVNIISLVSQASVRLQTNLQEAQQLLEMVKQAIPKIDTVWNETTRHKLSSIQRELESEVESIKRV